MSEDRKQLAKALVVLALLVIVPLVVMQLGPEEVPDQVAVQAVQSQYANTMLGLFYAPDRTALVDSATFPVTLTCQLRRGGSLGLVAEQVLTWTVPCAEAYTADLVVPPITLTWSFSEPLRAGPYEEFCQVEADKGIYGWVEGEPGQDGNNFFLTDKWTVEYNCYLPLVIKAGR